MGTINHHIPTIMVESQYSFMHCQKYYPQNFAKYCITNLRASIYSVKPGYNDIGLSDTSSTVSDILWCQLIHHCWPQQCISQLEQHSFITS